MLMWKELPPNFPAIVEKFPDAGKPGVIFAYSPDIYGVENGKIAPELKAHEMVHIERQGGDPDTWWGRYIIDQDFRYDEEYEAHVAEAKELMKLHGGNRKMRKKIADVVGRRLAAPLYQYTGKYNRKRAVDDIWHALTRNPAPHGI